MALLPEAITAGRLELRRWRPAFAEGLCDAVTASLAELRPWMPWAQDEPTVDGHRAVLTDGEASFDAGTDWQFVMVDVGSDRIVGAAGLHHRHGPATAEIGYWVRTDATRQGYATVTSRALTTAAFTHLPYVDTVEIRMDRGNARSAAVPARLGFHYRGDVLREIDAPGQCGTWMIWAMDRDAWDPSLRD